MTATFAEQTNNLIFVASGSLKPDLGSVAAYDAECDLRASAVGINDSSGRGYIAAVSGAASFWDRVPAGIRGRVRLDGLVQGITQRRSTGRGLVGADDDATIRKEGPW
jgi:hypothetical protein